MEIESHSIQRLAEVAQAGDVIVTDHKGARKVRGPGPNPIDDGAPA